MRTQFTNSPRRDLIVARATAAGPAAIAIVRLDGARSADVARRLFRPMGHRHPVDVPREAVYGECIEPGADSEVIDRGLCLFMKGPHSYTGNDLVEFQCHGSAVVIRRLLAACVRLGARPAEPGEFTRRAFLNGRLDLAQAEAVADLIRAETDAAAHAAQAQLAGGLSARIGDLRRELVDLAAEIEARIDFPDEGIEEADRSRLASAFVELQRRLASLLAMRGRGRLVREGVRVALVGQPNVGKSSLLNALARMERAIVTPQAGTTRDTVECVIDIHGIPVTLIDTAGLRDSADPVEAIGIERSRSALEEADFVIEVRDARAVRAGTAAQWREVRKPDLLVENKIDLVEDHDGGGGDLKATPLLEVSALRGTGMEELERRLAMLIGGESTTAARGDVFLINERHARLMTAALASVEQAFDAWDNGEGGELVIIDLREALGQLDELLGITPHEAVLDRIFERFCLGK